MRTPTANSPKAFSGDTDLKSEEESCNRRDTDSANIPRQQNSPERNELKGNVPTNSMYAIYKENKS